VLEVVAGALSRNMELLDALQAPGAALGFTGRTDALVVDYQRLFVLLAVSTEPVIMGMASGAFRLTRWCVGEFMAAGQALNRGLHVESFIYSRNQPAPQVIHLYRQVCHRQSGDFRDRPDLKRRCLVEGHQSDLRGLIREVMPEDLFASSIELRDLPAIRQRGYPVVPPEW